MSKKQFDELAQAFAEIHWMAQRYASGRKSYAVKMFNDATKKAIELGVELSPPLYAEDGMGKDFE